MTSVATSRPRGLLALALFVALCLAVGAVGGWVTAGPVRDWYPTLVKPAFNPPSWVFAPVWTTLYVLMALAAWRVWRTAAAGRGLALGAWGVQLALNLGWSFLFFGARAPAAALVEIAALWLAIVATMALFWRRDRWAGLLLAPYLAWVSFAALLNAEIWRLN